MKHAHAVEVDLPKDNGEKETHLVRLYPVNLNPCRLQQEKDFQSELALEVVQRVQNTIADFCTSHEDLTETTVAFAFNVLLCMHDTASPLDELLAKVFGRQ